MEIVQAQDQFTVNPDGKPSRVTDYKLFFPEDFVAISKPDLSFSIDQNYIQTSFKIVSGQIPLDVATLRARKEIQPNTEHGIVEINDGNNFYQAKTILTGESGIGFQVTPRLVVNDYLHTHITHKGEDEELADLFSAFDLWSMGTKGAERYWLVGKDTVWVLVNLYGQRYYYSIKEACWKMAKKYGPQKSYDENLSDLIECARRCEYRLYRSEDSVNFTLVS